MSNSVWTRGAGDERPAAIGRLKILLVEDHPDDAFLTLHSLRKNNFENVVVKDDAGKALDYLESRGCPDGEADELPHLILVDLKLPKMDGFDLIEAVRGNPCICHIPIAVLTSSVYAREKERCRELGVSAFFSKPLEMEMFTEFVSTCTCKG